MAALEGVHKIDTQLYESDSAHLVHTLLYIMKVLECADPHHHFCVIGHQILRADDPKWRITTNETHRVFTMNFTRDCDLIYNIRKLVNGEMTLRFNETPIDLPDGFDNAVPLCAAVYFSVTLEIKLPKDIIPNDVLAFCSMGILSDTVCKGFMYRDVAYETTNGYMTRGGFVEHKK